MWICTADTVKKKTANWSKRVHNLSLRLFAYQVRLWSYHAWAQWLLLHLSPAGQLSDYDSWPCSVPKHTCICVQSSTVGGGEQQVDLRSTNTRKKKKIRKKPLLLSVRLHLLILHRLPTVPRTQDHLHLSNKLGRACLGVGPVSVSLVWGQPTSEHKGQATQMVQVFRTYQNFWCTRKYSL